MTDNNEFKVHGYSCGVIVYERHNAKGVRFYLYNVGHPEQAIGSWGSIEGVETYIAGHTPEAKHVDVAEWDGWKWVTTPDIRAIASAA